MGKLKDVARAQRAYQGSATEPSNAAHERLERAYKKAPFGARYVAQQVGAVQGDADRRKNKK